MAQQAQNLVIEADECVTLTPESQRFKDIVQQYRPQTIAEVRKLIGPSQAVDASGKPTQACCMPAQQIASLPDPDALASEDPQVRFNARLQAAAAARAYVQAPDAQNVKYLEPLLDRYIQITRPILWGFLFADIDIYSGATLTLGPTAHLLFANNIRMHGTGRIVCKGPTTMRATSISGPTRLRVAGLVTATTASNLMRNA